MEMFEKAILIFGCGNILWGDDGFGPAVIECLNEKYHLPDDVLARIHEAILFNFDLRGAPQRPRGD